jgi:hypothetical protein
MLVRGAEITCANDVPGVFAKSLNDQGTDQAIEATGEAATE